MTLGGPRALVGLTQQIPKSVRQSDWNESQTGVKSDWGVKSDCLVLSQTVLCKVRLGGVKSDWGGVRLDWGCKVRLGV